MSKEFYSQPIDMDEMNGGVVVWSMRVGEPRTENWETFLLAANEWFVSYALPRSLLTSVKLFSIGHCVELYLKAAAAKLSGDVKQAVRHGHNLKAIWEECKAKDPDFMPMYEIRDAVLNAPIHNAKATQNVLSASDYAHFWANQEFYMICKILPDLKYIGAPMKKIIGDYSFAFVHPNSYWISFIRSIRDYLGPTKQSLDIIRLYIDDSNPPLGEAIPEQTKAYLRGLY